jgi:hypothetical protein
MIAFTCRQDRATLESDPSGLQGFTKVITVWECEYPRRFPLSSLWKINAINSFCCRILRFDGRFFIHFFAKMNSHHLPLDFS